MTLTLLALLLAQQQTVTKAGTSANYGGAVQGVISGVPVTVTCPDGTCAGGGGATTVTANQGTAGVADWKVNDSVNKAVLDAIKTDVDKIPSSPATDRTTAAAPFSVSISSGGAFIDPRQIRALTVSDIVGAAQSGAWSVGQSGTWTVGLSAGSNTVGKVDQGAAGAAAWLVGWSSAQPVSWSAQTVTVTQGTGTNLHAVLDSGTTTVTQGTGTNLHAVTDSGSTTAVTGNVTVVQPTGTNLHAVLDTTSTTAVTQATGTNLHAVIDSGSTTVATQGTAANLNATVTQGPAGASAWKVDGAGGTFPISGSINNTSFIATQGTGSNLHTVTDTGSVTSATVTNAFALDATLTSGAQKAQQVDASGNVQPAGDIDTRPVHTVSAGATTNFTDIAYLTPGAPTQLATHAARTVCVYNSAQSGGTAYVGASSATAYPTAGGIALQPGGDPYCRPIANSNQLFVLAPAGAALAFDGTN